MTTAMRSSSAAQMELAYKIRYLCSILDQLSEYQAGTIDLTQAAQKKATFQPAA